MESSLRFAGGVLFGLSAGLFLLLGGRWWAGLALLLVPDAAAAGFLLGPRLGVAAYNLAHRPLLPAAVLGLGVLTGWRAALLLALIWLGHIGVDRAAGYGLKDVSVGGGR